MLSKLVCLKPATANSWHFQDFKKIDIQSNQEMQSFPLTPGSAADGAEADNQASHLMWFWWETLIVATKVTKLSNYVIILAMILTLLALLNNSKAIIYNSGASSSIIEYVL